MTACAAGTSTDATRTDTTSKGSLAGRASLRIGVRADLPGIGEIVDGNPNDRRGFDIDVATYVARGLGARHIEWHDVSPETREDAIQSGEVDLVVANYAVTKNRMDMVSFAGPYRIGGLDAMIRSSDIGTITGLSSLLDKKVCAVADGTAPERLVQEFGKAWDVPEHMVRRQSTRQCANELLAGKVDAVAGGDMVLVGYVAEQPTRLHLVGHTYTVDNVGIGLAKSNAEDVKPINEILKRMIDDGTWAASVRKNFGPAADSTLANPPTPGKWEQSWAIPPS